jgi:hypothetical protein
MKSPYGMVFENYSIDLRVDGKVELMLILREQCLKVWTEFIRLRIGFSGKLI